MSCLNIWLQKGLAALVICKFTGLMIGKSGPHLLYLG